MPRKYKMIIENVSSWTWQYHSHSHVASRETERCYIFTHHEFHINNQSCMGWAGWWNLTVQSSLSLFPIFALKRVLSPRQGCRGLAAQIQKKKKKKENRGRSQTPAFTTQSLYLCVTRCCMIVKLASVLSEWSLKTCCHLHRLSMLSPWGSNPLIHPCLFLISWCCRSDIPGTFLGLKSHNFDKQPTSQSVCGTASVFTDEWMINRRVWPKLIETVQPLTFRLAEHWLVRVVWLTNSQNWKLLFGFSFNRTSMFPLPSVTAFKLKGELSPVDIQFQQ